LFYHRKLRRIQPTLCAKHIENKLFTIKTLWRSFLKFCKDVCKLINVFSIYKLIIILCHQTYCMTSSA